MKITNVEIYNILSVAFIFKSLYIAIYINDNTLFLIDLLFSLLFSSMADIAKLQNESNFKSKSGDIKIIKRQ